MKHQVQDNGFGWCRSFTWISFGMGCLFYRRSVFSFRLSDTAIFMKNTKGISQFHNPAAKNNFLPTSKLHPFQLKSRFDCIGNGRVVFYGSIRSIHGIIHAILYRIFGIYDKASLFPAYFAAVNRLSVFLCRSENGVLIQKPVRLTVIG